MARATHFIGLVVLAAILWRVDWDSMARVIQSAEPIWLAVAILLTLPLIWFKAMRWRRLAGIQDVRMERIEAFLYALGGLYLGIVTPGRVGEFQRAVYLKRFRGVAYPVGLSGILIDRLLDLYVLALLCVAGLAWLQPTPLAIGSTIIVSAMMVALFLFPFIRPDTVAGLLRRLSPRVLSRVGSSTEGTTARFVAASKQLLTPKLLVPLLQTALLYLFAYFICLLLARSLHLQLTLLQVILTMAMAGMVALAPISIAGLGTREAALIYLLGRLGISTEAALTYSLAVFLTFYLAGALFGLVGWYLAPLIGGSGSAGPVEERPKEGG